MCKHILFNEFQKSDLETLKTFSERTSDKDGFGAIIRLQSGGIKTLKSLNPGSFYIDLMQQVSRLKVQTLVVHHRTSTNQAGLDCAHPFEYGGNYLTHNGVVDVPGEHATKTKNDSEKLLHHLIKSNYDTETIEGYFSCFILNPTETVVLVDNMAPMFTDGRVYSSHKLGDDFHAVTMEKLTLCPKTGLVIDKRPIKVTESTWGLNQSSLSLGTWSNEQGWGQWDDPAPEANARFEMFYDMLTAQEEDWLYSIDDLKRLKRAIKRIGNILGIMPTETEVEQFAEYFHR